MFGRETFLERLGDLLEEFLFHLTMPASPDLAFDREPLGGFDPQTHAVTGDPDLPGLTVQGLEGVRTMMDIVLLDRACDDEHLERRRRDRVVHGRPPVERGSGWIGGLDSRLGAEQDHLLRDDGRLAPHHGQRPEGKPTQ